MKSTKNLSSSLANQIKLLHNHLSQEESKDYDIITELYADDVVIKDGIYQAVTPDEVVRQLPHLNTQQKSKLKMVFEKYKTVFDGTLGKHPIAKIDIQLVPGAKLIYQNLYPVLFKRNALFGRELANMIADGVFTKIGESEWGFPSFIIPKEMAKSNGFLTSKSLTNSLSGNPFRYQGFKISSIREDSIHTSPR